VPQAGGLDSTCCAHTGANIPDSREFCPRRRCPDRCNPQIAQVAPGKPQNSRLLHTRLARLSLSGSSGHGQVNGGLDSTRPACRCLAVLRRACSMPALWSGKWPNAHLHRLTLVTHADWRLDHFLNCGRPARTEPRPRRLFSTSNSNSNSNSNSDANCASPRHSCTLRTVPSRRAAGGLRVVAGVWRQLGGLGGTVNCLEAGGRSGGDRAEERVWPGGAARSDGENQSGRKRQDCVRVAVRRSCESGGCFFRRLGSKKWTMELLFACCQSAGCAPCTVTQSS